MLPLRRTRTNQPNGDGISPDYSNGLACLINPAIGKTDLVSGKAYSTSEPISIGRGGKIQENLLDPITLGASISVSAGSNFTCAIQVDPINPSTSGNAAFFRSASGTDTFCIIELGSSLLTPWVRLNGVDVYRAFGSGQKIPTGRPVAVVFSVMSGNRVDIAWDGAIRHSANFSTTTPAFTFNVFGSQGGEHIGNMNLFAFWTKYYDPSAISANPWQIFL